MLLKFQMPELERGVQGGTIVKWHKAEGDRVDYGDDICDVKVEHFRVLQRSNRPEVLSSLSESKIRARTNFRDSYSRVLFFRVTSSDTGIMHRILATEGEDYSVGDLLAVLTTDEHEPAEMDDQALARASALRIVVNPIEI